MKIVFIADTHDKHRDVILPKGDVLVHAGDMVNVLNHDSIGCVKVIRDVDDWFGELDFKKIICIAGNHEYIFQDGLASGLRNAVYLEDEHYEFEGVKFFGSPWTPHFFGAFNANEHRLGEIFKKADDDVDVLITHGPPHGILDTPSRSDHAGSHALASELKRIKPKVHVFGHIHDSYGEYNDGTTQFYNAAMSRAHGQVKENKPWVFEIES
jgi:Icc-related predicted phosphoesterase